MKLLRLACYFPFESFETKNENPKELSFNIVHHFILSQILFENRSFFCNVIIFTYLITLFTWGG